MAEIIKASNIQKERDVEKLKESSNSMEVEVESLKGNSNIMEVEVPKEIETEIVPQEVIEIGVENPVEEVFLPKKT